MIGFRRTKGSVQSEESTESETKFAENGFRCKNVAQLRMMSLGTTSSKCCCAQSINEVIDGMSDLPVSVREYSTLGGT